jgi:hypothetical protein
MPSPGPARRLKAVLDWLTEVVQINPEDSAGYASALTTHGYDDVSALGSLLDESELLEVMKMKRGHARKMLQVLSRQQQ